MNNNTENVYTPVSTNPQHTTQPIDTPTYVQPANPLYVQPTTTTQASREQELRSALDSQTIKNMTMLRLLCACELMFAVIALIMGVTVDAFIMAIPDILGIISVQRLYAPGLLVLFLSKSLTLFLIVAALTRFVGYIASSSLLICTVILVSIVQIIILILSLKIRRKWVQAKERIEARNIEMNVTSSYALPPSQITTQQAYPMSVPYAYPISYDQQQQPQQPIMTYAVSPQPQHHHQPHVMPYGFSPQQQHQPYMSPPAYYPQQQPSIPPYPSYALPTPAPLSPTPPGRDEKLES
eukprot:TRINITY_DN1824_c0_g1_i1.p1 TRINITY_DN1824_c0_g1~~TRINITY_DN1824_c0_g1_i1.p1  ORF type:complete len:295 (+),score=71.39 TRINITY_DN1824_c0_g1_i1:66-950(+)